MTALPGYWHVLRHRAAHPTLKTRAIRLVRRGRLKLAQWVRRFRRREPKRQRG
jgi:hypothetical protein